MRSGMDDVQQLELETLDWVHWFAEGRLHSHCDDVPPAGFEAASYPAQQTTRPGWKRKPQSPSEPAQLSSHRSRRRVGASLGVLSATTESWSGCQRVDPLVARVARGGPRR